MKKLYHNFLQSAKAQLSPESTSYRHFILNETYINGSKFSFKKHEYQDYVLRVVEESPGGSTISVMKCSQIGLSEIFNRLICAKAALMPGSGILVSFPTKTFSQEVFKTRITSVINSSPRLSSLIDRNNDSASVKAFHNGSIMYALAGSVLSESSLLNRPANTVFIDEQDRQDPKIITSYDTRMKHTPPDERMIINVSTPTADGIGIDAEIKESRFVHTPWIKCPCGHEFIADFFTDIIIPGLDEPLALLTKTKAARLDLLEAYLACPTCGISLNYDNIETVWKITENPDGVRNKIGIVIDPFAALGFLTIPDLVNSYITNESQIEFINQSLGKTADKSDSSINTEAIRFIPEKVTGAHIYGLDLGKKCHWLHGIMKPDTTVHVVDSEIINLSELEEFLSYQHTQFVFSAGVIDSQPYTDLVYKFVKRYSRLFSAIYVSPNPPVPRMYELKMQDKNGEIVRQININKSVVMDSFAGMLENFFTFQPSQYDAAIAKHFTDMRRVRDYRFNEMIYKWIKSSKGEDHFWHTGVYLFMAAKLAMSGLASSAAIPAVIRKINVDKARERIRRGR